MTTTDKDKGRPAQAAHVDPAGSTTEVLTPPKAVAAEADARRAALRQLLAVIEVQEVVRAAVVVDAIRQAYAATWTRRAEDFQVVGTDEGDLIALECRRHAWLIAELAGEPWPGAAEDYTAVMAESRDQLATVAEGVAP